MRSTVRKISSLLKFQFQVLSTTEKFFLLSNWFAQFIKKNQLTVKDVKKILMKIPSYNYRSNRSKVKIKRVDLKTKKNTIKRINKILKTNQKVKIN